MALRTQHSVRWWEPIAAGATTIAAAVVLVYACGAAVMLLRLHHAGVPEFEGVAVLPREQLLAIGFANLLGPYLVALLGVGAAFAFVLRRLEHPPRRLSRRPPSKPRRRRAREWWKGKTRDWEPETVYRVQFSLLAAASIPLVLAFAVPVDWADGLFNLLLFVLFAYTFWRLRLLALPPRPPTHRVRIEIGCIWGIAIFSAAVSEEAIRPMPLATVSVSTTTGPIGGYYLNSRSDGLFVGQRDYVVLIPTSAVRGPRSIARRRASHVRPRL